MHEAILAFAIVSPELLSPELAGLDNIPRLFRLAIARPRLHELAALLQRVAPPIGLFGLVSDDVSKSSFQTSRGKLETLPAQSRKLERKPWTVASSIFIRASTISIAMFESGLLRALPGKRTRWSSTSQVD